MTPAQLQSLGLTQPSDNRVTHPGNVDAAHEWGMQNDPNYAAGHQFRQRTANQGLQDTSLDMLDFVPGLGAIAMAGTAAKGARRGAADIMPGYNSAGKGARATQKYTNYYNRMKGASDMGLDAEYSKLLKDKPSYELEGLERDKYMALENITDDRMRAKGDYGYSPDPVFDDAPYPMMDDAYDYTDNATGKRYSDGMSAEEFLEIKSPQFAEDWARAGRPTISDNDVDLIANGKTTLDKVIAASAK